MRPLRHREEDEAQAGNRDVQQLAGGAAGLTGKPGAPVPGVDPDEWFAIAEKADKAGHGVGAHGVQGGLGWPGRNGGRCAAAGWHQRH
jgi:hypothetical protein